MRRACTLLIVLAGACHSRSKEAKPAPLDHYVREAMQEAASAAPASAGSLWSANGPLFNLAGDVRARQVHDLVTIVVAERASAVTKGSSNGTRSLSAQASIGALGGVLPASGPLANLAALGGKSSHAGEGATSRASELDATLTARVVAVLPNGNLVVEGAKLIRVNSEQQELRVRGVVRPNDLNAGNAVLSSRVGQLEVSLNGKGVVGDAVKRPFFLYRLLMGLLPL